MFRCPFFDKTASFDINVPGATGKLRNEVLPHARDRPRRVTVTTHLSLLPLDTEHPAQVVGEHSRVQFRQCDHGRMHGPTIERVLAAMGNWAVSSQRRIT
jgi:hypothetical protein